ncbi:fructose-1,6-bisphosphatase [Candidatus Micrarchaeota archaeon]|nr:fructose-1,6-bisphosphatase [Candidatus Micrarchaeota archaeon]
MAEELFDHVEGAAGDGLARLLNAIANASIQIRIEMPHLMGFSDGSNKYGEQILKLDEWTNKFLCDTLVETGLVRRIYSEELNAPVEGIPDAPYVVCIDPLDGSSNVKTNNTCGTIVGVYEKEVGKGSEQVAALYKLYGPVTTVTYSVGKGVHEFIKQRKGEVKFVLSKENMRLPEKAGVYGVGGKREEWPPKLREFVDSLEGRGMKLRYSGTLVADFNQVLHYGGLFAYPKAKLRLAYEAKPLAFLAKEAGGKASNGFKDILEVEDDVDARTPLFLGNGKLIEEIEKLK